MHFISNALNNSAKAIPDRTIIVSSPAMIAAAVAVKSYAKLILERNWFEWMVHLSKSVCCAQTMHRTATVNWLRPPEKEKNVHHS